MAKLIVRSVMSGASDSIHDGFVDELTRSLGARLTEETCHCNGHMAIYREHGKPEWFAQCENCKTTLRLRFDGSKPGWDVLPVEKWPNFQGA
jgi:hypothetical protein